MSYGHRKRLVDQHMPIDSLKTHAKSIIDHTACSTCPDRFQQSPTGTSAIKCLSRLLTISRKSRGVLSWQQLLLCSQQPYLDTDGMYALITKGPRGFFQHSRTAPRDRNRRTMEPCQATAPVNQLALSDNCNTAMYRTSKQGQDTHYRVPGWRVSRSQIG
jgi:hypothetical protein